MRFRLTPGGCDRRPKRVTRTGLAVVHEGETVYPSAGSEAQAVAAGDDAQAAVQVVFPVEVEVVTGGAEGEADLAAAELMTRAARRLRRLG